jgi:ABC-2 type transport system ATP-binding protein
VDAVWTGELSRRFGRRLALDRIAISVPPHSLFALLGPDGAGKTTLCRILAGILDPSEGSARVCGYDVVREREVLKRHIGYMPQGFGLYPDLTVEENVHFYADLYGTSKADRRAPLQRLLELTNLAPFVRRQARHLSGGMKQKLTLAACLIHTPQVLILDEPTLGVDPISRREFWKLLYDLLREGVSIFVATSYMDEAQRCHRAALLHQGRLIACDTPDGVRRLVPGAMVALVPSDMSRAVAVLREAPGIRQVAPFGATVRVLSDPGTNVLAVLEAAGLTATEVRPTEPTLEDAFIYLVQSTSNGPSAAGSGGTLP